jgi:hypothetical protein
MDSVLWPKTSIWALLIGPDSLTTTATGPRGPCAAINSRTATFRRVLSRSSEEDGPKRVRRHGFFQGHLTGVPRLAACRPVPTGADPVILSSCFFLKTRIGCGNVQISGF